jgi:hypothetical protein
MHQIELLGDVGHVESCFGPYGDSVGTCKIGAQFVPNIPQSQKSFWTHSMALLGCETQVEAHFSPF